GLIGPDDRPDHPEKITSTTVLINPFTDIEPRVQETIADEAPKKKKKDRQGVKNFGLLSFGDEAEEDETEVQEYRGKPKSTHDLLEDPKLSKLTAEEEIKKKQIQTETTVTNIRDKLTSKKRESSTDRESKKIKGGGERDERDSDGDSGGESPLKREMKGNKEQKITEQNEQAEVERKKPWIKNLYENREYPDNYTHPKFLEELRKNIYAEKVTLSQAVKGSFRVVLRICICVLYAVLFFYMYNDLINTYTVIYTSILTTLLSYILYIYINGSAVLSHFKTVLVYLVLGYLLSPILHTLTDTVSTDTIFAWAVIMMLVHLIFFDYDVPAAIVSKSLSINAAIFASVCLVSRLSSPFDAFVLLTVSVIFFVLSPQFIQVYLYTQLFSLVYIFTVVLTLVSLYTVSITLMVYFVFMVLLVSLYCPLMFVKWQRYKDN
ncbi:putative serologically defined colon cancer antigen 10, partial [Operophtera brumata]